MYCSSKTAGGISDKILYFHFLILSCEKNDFTDFREKKNVRHLKKYTLYSKS